MQFILYQAQSFLLWARYYKKRMKRSFIGIFRTCMALMNIKWLGRFVLLVGGSRHKIGQHFHLNFLGTRCNYIYIFTNTHLGVLNCINVITVNTASVVRLTIFTILVEQPAFGGVVGLYYWYVVLRGDRCKSVGAKGSRHKNLGNNTLLHSSYIRKIGYAIGLLFFPRTTGGRTMESNSVRFT
jgi:hypothetical protein